MSNERIIQISTAENQTFVAGADGSAHNVYAWALVELDGMQSVVPMIKSADGPLLVTTNDSGIEFGTSEIWINK